MTLHNDGLTVEFYETFWGILGKLLVESLNCAFDHGDLSKEFSQSCLQTICPVDIWQAGAG